MGLQTGKPQPLTPWLADVQIQQLLQGTGMPWDINADHFNIIQT